MGTNVRIGSSHRNGYGSNRNNNQINQGAAVKYGGLPNGKNDINGAQKGF